MKISLKAALSVLGVSILWGGNIVSIKIALEGLSPMMMAGIRFSLGILVVFFWTRINRISLKVDGQEFIHHLINGLLFTLQITLFYLGTNLTSASHAVILINTNIFFLSVLSHFFILGDRLTVLKIAGLLLAVIGVSSLFSEPSFPQTPSAFSGNLLVLLSAGILGAKTIYVKRLIERIDPSKVLLWQMAIGIPLFFLLAYLQKGTEVEINSLPILAALLYQGIVVAGFCFVAANLLLKHHPPTAISVFFFAVPVSGVVLSHWILGEAVTKNVILGTALVALGIVMVSLKEKVVVELDKP